MHNFLKESSRSHRKSGNIHKGFPVPGSVSGDPGRKCQGHPSHVLRRYQQELRGQQESGLWQIQEAEPWYVCKYAAGIRTILSDEDNSSLREELPRSLLDDVLSHQ